HQLKLRVPLDLLCVCAKLGLVAPNRSDPRTQTAQLFLQRLDLSQPAALVRVRGPERVPIHLGLRGRGQARLDTLDLDSILFFHFLDESIRFREQEPGIDSEYSQRRSQRRGDIDQRHPLWAESRRHFNAGSERAERPRQNFLRAPTFCELLRLLEMSDHCLHSRSWGTASLKNKTCDSADEPTTAEMGACAFSIAVS